MRKHLLNTKFLQATILGVGIISSTASFAANTAPKKSEKTEPYESFIFGSKDNPHWLGVGGVLKLDQRMFFRNKRGELHSGASVRSLGIDLAGGIGKDLTFTLGTAYDATDSKVNVEEAFITYSGFHGFGPNFSVSIGQVNPGFSLAQTSSSKWIPFLERDLASNAFGVDPGLGVSVSKWQDKSYSVTAAVTQPRPVDRTTNETGAEVKRSDRWQANVRGTKAHFFDAKKFVQLGASAQFKHDGDTGIGYSTGPEAKSRHSTNMLLNTTTPSGTKIQSSSNQIGSLEFTGQDGPLSGQAEYQLAKVNRYNSQGENLNFHGYHAHVNYVLTGEAREYKSSLGTLGQVIPYDMNKGAWEVSGRYSFLNLNNKDVAGGTAHNVGAAFTWYANYNIAVTGEYIRSHITRSFTLEKLKIDTVGARLQFVF